MSNAIPSFETMRQAYAAKQQYDALDAEYDVGARASKLRDVAERAQATVDRARASVRAHFSETNVSLRANGEGSGMSRATGASANASGERRWRCHAAIKATPNGGRGVMQDAFLRQPIGVPMVMLEVKGEIVDRMGLPMGKDELKKGEMLTCGTWLVRVVGLEGAIPEAPRMVVKSEGLQETKGASGGGTVGANEGAGRGGGGAGRAPAATPEPTLATQPRSGLEAPGARREYYREPSGQDARVGAATGERLSMQHQAPPARTPKYQIYEPAPRAERAIDPDTGERERWLGGGWRGRADGDYRPRAVTQDEVHAARERLLQLEHDARIRAEVAASEAAERHRQAEEARAVAESAMHQMSQAEAANRAVREAEYAAAEAKRLASFAVEHQREAESQFISMLPIDDARNAEEQRRLAEMEDIQRRIAEHERAARAETTAVTPPASTRYAVPPQQYHSQQQQQQQQQYHPPQQQQQQQQYYPPQQQQQQQYYPPQQQQQQQQYYPPQQQQQQQYHPPQQQQHQTRYEPQAPARATAQYIPPMSTAQSISPSSPQRATAEIVYTASPSNVKDRAAAFGHVTIKPMPTSRANASEQTYAHTGTSTTSASAHALAQIMRQERPPEQRQGESPEELKRKIEILERFAKTRGMLDPK